ncbi:MAG: preprotein translocase subunit SecA [Deltaproteobacteria bacterium]|jgi:preprotein translocase subunit SecA|nr:preprotein translocase subunit SecA [Deltaproteobacteria bacterium]
MLQYVLNKIFGSRNERELRRLWPLVERINQLEAKYLNFSLDDLKNQTNIFKERLATGETLDDILPEAFAVVRETSKRVLGMRHFDVQLLGGIVLHQGKIAEMKTGEGKTLCATLPLYLNALTGKGVHLVTVNDYLAKRDAEWMGRIYRSLGLTVGCIVEQLNDQERIVAYRSDIIYGQNNQFGFDYLRDNMKVDFNEMVQRGFNFAIVDEVDSILIDEARTPLIISSAGSNPTETYGMANALVHQLIEENKKILAQNKKDNLLPPKNAKESEQYGEYFYLDLKGKNIALNDAGVRRIETLLNINNLYNPENINVVHHVTQALKANIIMKRDIDYMVKDNQVVIIDEFTGRQMDGRRWSDGLHQAIEAKEGVPIARESETLGTVTFQNYFRMYAKLSGMTGTADTEAIELKKIYNLDVVMIPPNMPMIREDKSDQIYVSIQEKYKAVCNEIKELHQKGQPILVGTISIEASEQLSAMLKKMGIKHNVLNAKFHEQEAEIIAQAGRLNAVTISTNMAGRGTDILLGGNPDFFVATEGVILNPFDPNFDAELYKERLEFYKAQCAEEHEEVVRVGGLYIIGTERHESRRIDNQLRGRAGRQGDPGSSQFYVSLEDDLMKRFGGEKMQVMMRSFGMTDEAISGRLVARAIEQAQKKVESYHFDVRKHLFDYDNVLNKQREVIYSLRTKILQNENNQDFEESILELIADAIEALVMDKVHEKVPVEDWDIIDVCNVIEKVYSLTESAAQNFEDQKKAFNAKEMAQSLFDYYQNAVLQKYKECKTKFGAESFLKLIRVIYLQVIDYFWKEHLANMTSLREGIGLRGYGQKNPLYEYQREAFVLFEEMIFNINVTVSREMFNVELLTDEEIRERQAQEQKRQHQIAETAKAVHHDTQVAQKSVAASNLNRQQRRLEEKRNKKHSK